MVQDEKKAGFVKGLGLLSATNIVIGSMIGSGIFIAPSLMAGYIQTPGLLVLLWVLGGIITICAALSMAELASAFPRAGGQYVFLREIYSPAVGFLFGWTIFLVIQTGFIAAVSIAFAKYLGVFFPFLGEKQQVLSVALAGRTFSLSSAQLVSILGIVILTVINIRGVKWGALVQNLFTVAKVAALLVLGGSALLIGAGSFKNFLPLLKPVLPPAASLPLFAALAVAMSKALFAYDAWNSVTFVAEEVRHPQRNVPRALFWGSGITMLVNVLAVMAYIYIIPVERLALVAENRVGGAVAEAVLGPAGLVFITLAILVSTFGCVNGLILSGARLYYAMARDRVFFETNGRLHPRYQTPHLALVFQGIWSCLLVVTGTYNDLLTYTVFGSLLFNVLTVAGVIRLRSSRPDLERPYRVFAYPVLPLFYVAVAGFFIVYIVIGDPFNSLKGILVMLSGIPAYLFWKKRSAKQR